jgi:hypothetical protein
MAGCSPVLRICRGHFLGGLTAGFGQDLLDVSHEIVFVEELGPGRPADGWTEGFGVQGRGPNGRATSNPLRSEKGPNTK